MVRTKNEAKSHTQDRHTDKQADKRLKDRLVCLIDIEKYLIISEKERSRHSSGNHLPSMLSTLPSYTFNAVPASFGSFSNSNAFIMKPLFRAVVIFTSNPKQFECIDNESTIIRVSIKPSKAQYKKWMKKTIINEMIEEIIIKMISILHIAIIRFVTETVLWFIILDRLDNCSINIYFHNELFVMRDKNSMH